MATAATVTETAPFTPTLKQQQVFALSCLSNRAPEQMAKDLQTWAPNIGAWEIVWGPCSTAPTGDLNKANSMLVARAVNAAQPTYVVAIAGTNPISSFDWFTEDLNISPTDWPYAPNAGQVTTGDLDGLKSLLQMEYQGQTLQQFLSALPGKSSTSLSFTGSSLGGALSPMLTLALMDPASTVNADNDVSLGNWAEVSLLAIAGPSMGDAAFVSYFNTVLAKASCQFIWNAHDVVPHSWNAATMMELTSPANIYGLTLDPTQPLAMKLAYEQQQAAGQNYVQFEPVPAFSGTLQPYAPPSSQEPAWTPESQFLAQTIYQHTLAYVSAFACEWMTGTVPNYCNDSKAAEDLLDLVNSQLFLHPTYI